MCLDTKGKLISFDFIGEGDISSVGISMRDLAKTVLNSGAVAAVLAHNHPNGIAVPSENDLYITQTVADIFSKIGVQLIDHIIISDSDFVSMAQSEKYAYIFVPS